jgi:histidinol phosphatase-like PHP family hydrolase
MQMPHLLTRRGFLGATVAVSAYQAASPLSAGTNPQTRRKNKIALVDYHVHLDDVVTLEKALERSRETGVEFGIVEHAGTTANKYRNLISTDAQLDSYLAKLSGKPVWRGIQAEGVDWMTCFSKTKVAQLDYVLSDALTLPDRDGKARTEIWRPWVQVDDKNEFMDRYTDFNVKIMAVEPIDIIANPTFLPECLSADFDRLWTEKRMRSIVDAAVRYRVAIEINSNYKLPRLPFLKMAKDAGAKFSLGSNIHGLRIGDLAYCEEMIDKLQLEPKHMFTPAKAGRKPIQTRKLVS